MEKIQKVRSKSEMFVIVVVGSALIYYGAIFVVAAGLWLNTEYHALRNDFRAWVIGWDTGKIEITLEETKGGGGIVLANGSEVETYDQAVNYLFIQSQELSMCKARLRQIKDLIPGSL